MEQKDVCHGKLSTRIVRHSVEDRLHKLHFSWRIDNWREALTAELRKTQSGFLLLSSFVDDKQLGAASVGVWRLMIDSMIRKGKLVFVTPDLLRRGSGEEDDCRASAAFSLLAHPSDEELWNCTLQTRFLKDNTVLRGTYFPTLNLNRTKNQSKLSMVKSIVVEVTLTFEDCAYSRSFSSSAAQKSRLFDMYKAESMTDFSFVSSDKKTVRCHRLILASSCDAFSAMLHHDTREAKSGVCELEDVDYDTVRIMIDSIYGVSVRARIKVVPEDVYRVADKYDLRRLKDCCIKPLKDTISLANCVDRYLFALQYDLVGVTEKVADFVRKNSKKFLEIGGVRKLLEKAPRRVLRVGRFRRVSESQEAKRGGNL